ncbi:OmpA family protein [Alphaproteobacteria bacterium KMM 3653]|uniref:OmpA family protein n=2 Tax=Harenicola maris TaxID=2841044 RepID=A0AAP2G8G5_9RHOB|nr:OmpA family protein [Harenicola maris]
MLPAAAMANDLAPGWSLDGGASNIRFQSVKNETVVESSSFASFEGSIAEDGAVDLRVILESVDTKIDLRNVRMRFLFFETFKYPEAQVTAQVTPEMLEGLETSRRKTVTMPFSLDLHGIKKTLLADVAVTLLSDNRVSVASTAPVSIAVADFGLTENIAKLEEAAGGISIIPSATVTFDFLFDRNGTGTAVAGAAQPTTGSAALETTGNFDAEACLGRFEILSNTGNIYFRPGSAQLDAESVPLLTEVVDIVSRCPDLRIELAGHTDSKGSEAANQRLSERRAGSVLRYLTERGIAANRLTAKGYGEAQPVASNDTAQGMSRNRRIEFLVVQ